METKTVVWARLQVYLFLILTWTSMGIDSPLKQIPSGQLRNCNFLLFTGCTPLFWTAAPVCNVARSLTPVKMIPCWELEAAIGVDLV